jgi:hypothetical protein
MCVTTDTFFINIATTRNQPVTNYWLTGPNDNDQVIEEPDELKGSSPVLKPSGGGDSAA